MKDSVGPRRGGTVAREPVADDVEVVLALAVAARCHAVAVQTQGEVAQGQLVVPEAVGTLVVVSHESIAPRSGARGGASKGGEPHDEAVVHAQMVLALQSFVDGIERFFGTVAVVILEDELLDTGFL